MFAWADKRKQPISANGWGVRLYTWKAALAQKTHNLDPFRLKQQIGKKI